MTNMFSTSPASDAWFQFSRGTINFATCGMIANGGTIAYINGELGDDKVDRYEDAKSAKLVLDMLLFANVIDNFQTYMSDILLEILEIDPRPLYGKKVSADLLFESVSLEDLRRSVIDKYLQDTGYQGVEKLSETLDKDFGLKSLRHWLTKKRINRLIQIRNIITHNRGTVNSTFLFRTGSKIDAVGDPVRFTAPLSASRYISQLVRRIDHEAVSKFSLK